MTSYIIKPDQSLFDIAVEVYGDVSGVVWLLQDNPNIPGATGPIYAGEPLAIRAEMMNSRMADNLADYGPFQTITEADKPIGIGFWRLENYVIQ